MSQRKNLLISGLVIAILLTNISFRTQAGILSQIPTPTPLQSQALDARDHLRQAAILHDAKEYDQAIEEYWQALTLEPSLVMAYRGLGNAYVDKGNPQEAIDRFTALLTNDSQKNGCVYYGIGNVYYKNGAYDEAKQAYEKAIEQDPNLAMPYNGLSAIYNKQGDAQQAEVLARKALQIDPGLRFAHDNLLSSLRANLSNEEIVAEYENQIAGQPTTLTADQIYLAAGSYYKLQNYDKAATAFQKVIDQYPDSYWADNAYYFLANIFLIRQEYEKTISTIEKAITAYPVSDKSFALYRILGGLYSKVGDYEKARTMFEIALTNHIDQGILEENGAVLAALEEFIRVIDLGGGEAYGLLQKIEPLVFTHECQQSYPLAEQLLDISQKVDFIQGQLAAQETIISCLNDLGIPPEQRIELIQKYLELATMASSIASEADALISLAHVYMALGNYQEAYSIYSQLLVVCQT